MGDVPSFRDAIPSVNLQAIDRPRGPRQGGWLETGGTERSVTVGERADPPRSRPVSRIDPKKKEAEFRGRYPKFSDFVADYPALEHVHGIRPLSLGSFVRTIEAIAERTGNKSYKALLEEFGPEILQSGILALKIRQFMQKWPKREFKTDNAVILNDIHAKSAFKNNYNTYKLKSSAEALIAKYWNNKTWKLNESYFANEDTFSVKKARHLCRFVELSDKIPGGTGIFRTNENYSTYFKELFNATATERFVDRCIQEFPKGVDADPAEVDRIGTAVGLETFREILLSQMRTEAEAPDFKARPDFSRIMVQGLKTLYETGDAEKALAAARAEADACSREFPQGREAWARRGPCRSGTPASRFPSSPTWVPAGATSRPFGPSPCGTSSRK